MSVFPTKILLSTDGSEDALRAARVAMDLSRSTGSELHVVHVAPAVPLIFAHTDQDPDRIEQEARTLLEGQVERIRTSGGTVAGTHLSFGEPAREIVALAEELEAGLIVVGNRGIGGIRRALMGSVSSSVVRHAHCPVLVVRE